MKRETNGYFRKNPLVPIVLVFCGGLWSGMALHSPVVGTSICLAAYLGLLFFSRRKKHLVWLLIFMVGAWRISLADRKPSLRLPKNRTLCKIRCHITEAPCPPHWTENNDRTDFLARLEQIHLSRGWTRIRAGAKVICKGPISCCRGDKLEIIGELLPIRGPGNPGCRDAKYYWRAKKINYLLLVSHPDNARLLERNCGCPVLNCLSRVRLRYVAMLRDDFGPEAGNFLSALVLGEKCLLSRDTREKLAAAGVIHMLAISGLHVSIMALLLWRVLMWLKLSLAQASLTLMLCCGIYSVLTGLYPPVVRASLMMIICLSAPLIGRRAAPMNSLAAAALVILWLTPYQLFLPGFQLSFVACAAIFHWSRFPRRFFGDTEEKPKTASWSKCIQESLWVSLVASFATAPLIACHFAILTPLSPFFSLVLLPLISFLFAGCLLLLFSPLGLGLGKAALVWFIEPTFYLFMQLLKACFSLPGRFYPLPPLGSFVAIFCLVVILWPILKKRFWGRAMPLIAFFLVIFSGHFRELSQYQCGITVLDVGHGSAIYLKLPGKKHLLYDCGSTSPAIGERVILPFLRARGINRLDAVIISHDDTDHYNGFAQIASRMSIGKLIVNGAMPEQSAVLQIAHSRKIPVLKIRHRQVLREFPQITFLWPGKKLLAHRKQRDNEQSLAILAILGSRRILLTADLTGPALKSLLAENVSQIDVLQVPHHGGIVEGTLDLVKRTNPKIALISARKESMDPKTLGPYERNNTLILNTAKTGAIDIECSKGQIHISRFRRSEPCVR